MGCAAPTGLDAAGNLRAVVPATANGFAHARLEHGMQLRVNGIVKNVLFYGPATVRVNTNSGESFARHPSIVVVAKPANIQFEISDGPERVTLSSQRLRIVADKKTGALTFLTADGLPG